jgi:hypothetical protein
MVAVAPSAPVTENVKVIPAEEENMFDARPLADDGFARVRSITYPLETVIVAPLFTMTPITDAEAGDVPIEIAEVNDTEPMFEAVPLL